MAANEFVAISWSPNQLLDKDVLDTLNNNMIYLRDQMVDGAFQHRLGGATTTGIKILCGTATVPPRASPYSNITVNFAKMFSPNSRPTVVTTVVSTVKRPVHIVTQGIGSALPTQNGFIAKVTVAPWGKVAGRITNTMYIHWIAMGY